MQVRKIRMQLSITKSNPRTDYENVKPLFEIEAEVSEGESLRDVYLALRRDVVGACNDLAHAGLAALVSGQLPPEVKPPAPQQTVQEVVREVARQQQATPHPAPVSTSAPSDEESPVDDDDQSEYSEETLYEGNEPVRSLFS